MNTNHLMLLPPSCRNADGQFLMYDSRKMAEPVLDTCTGRGAAVRHMNFQPCNLPAQHGPYALTESHGTSAGHTSLQAPGISPLPIGGISPLGNGNSSFTPLPQTSQKATGLNSTRQKGRWGSAASRKEPAHPELGSNADSVVSHRIPESEIVIQNLAEAETPARHVHAEFPGSRARPIPVPKPVAVTPHSRHPQGPSVLCPPGFQV